MEPDYCKYVSMSATNDIFQLGIKALIIDRSSGAILLLQVATAHFAGSPAPYWDLPGGRVARGESVAQTLRREVAEETGIEELRSLQLFTTVVSKIRIPYQDTDTGLLLQVYVANVEQKPAVHLSDEHTDYEWVSPQEAASRLQVKYPAMFTDALERGEGL